MELIHTSSLRSVPRYVKIAENLNDYLSQSQSSQKIDYIFGCLDDSAEF